jgi:hypothetical protein
MNLDYVLLPAATLGLWVPSAAIASSAIRNKLRQASRRRHDGISSLLRSYPNWIDLARGAGCAWLLTYLLSSVPAGKSELATVYMVTKFIILAIGVIAQCILIGRPIRVVGPVFYLIGLTMVLSGPQVGAFALILGLTCALMFQRLTLLFLFAPAFTILFGKVFGQLGLPQVVNAALLALPLFLSFALNVRLSYVRRPLPDSNDMGGREVEEIQSDEESVESASITPIFGTSGVPSQVTSTERTPVIAQLFQLSSVGEQRSQSDARPASVG